MINRIKRHFKDKYLIISSENGDIIQKYQGVFDGIKEVIKKINDYGQIMKYDDNYMKIKFNTGDNIPLNKIIYFITITIIIRSVTKKDDKYYECNICYYWYFLDKNFNYGLYRCNRCHDLMQKAVSFKSVAVISIKVNDYRIHFWHISKNDADFVITNSNLSDKNGVLQIFFYHI